MAPTVYEIGEHFQIQPPTAFAHLRALQRKGYVHRSSKARSLTLLRGSAPKHLSLTLSIPLLGRISAGLPLLAEENIEETIQADPALLPRGIGGHRLFALRVHGESMRDSGILDKDVIIAKEAQTAEINAIVVVLVNDEEATVKHFHLADGEVELRPANPDFQPQRYPIEQVRIQGAVIALYRKY
jgi:repressor LexA